MHYRKKRELLFERKIMGWLKKRRLRKHIKSINFMEYFKAYGETGEYKALAWLNAYVEGRASAEPMELIRGMLRTSPGGINDEDRTYILTILQWC